MPTTADSVVRSYVTDGLAYRQKIYLLKDGTYRHTVFQSTGNSVSTREEKWMFEYNGKAARVILKNFKPVVTHKDFAVHRVWGINFKDMTFSARSGYFDTIILSSDTDPPVEYVSTN